MYRIASSIKSQEFIPSKLGIFFNPFYLFREAIASSVREFAVRASGPVLDLGCGESPYRALFEDSDYIGVDLTAKQPRLALDCLVYDGRNLPFSNESFSAILATEVLEHVLDLPTTISEIYRVAAPGALILATVPFMWPEHEMPHDFRRFTTAGLRQLFENAGLKVLNICRLGNGLVGLIQLWNAYIVELTLRSPPAIRRIILGILTVPANIIGALVSAFYTRDSPLFLGSAIYVQKPLLDSE